MKLGANHPMGPLELGDLIGLDVCLAIMDVLYQETGDSKYRASLLLARWSAPATSAARPARASTTTPGNNLVPFRCAPHIMRKGSLRRAKARWRLPFLYLPLNAGEAASPGTPCVPPALSSVE